MHLKGKTIAAAQYAAGADVVYQVAGWYWCWCIQRSKIINETRNESESLGHGVDRDQNDER